MFQGISKFTSLCVWAAVLRAIIDGWTTHSRMQRRSRCLFGCGCGQDSIQHYAFCSVLADLARRKLGLEIPEPRTRLDEFLMLEPRFTVDQSSWFARCALLIYATFKATNAARDGQGMDTSDAWQQAFKEGAASRRDLGFLIGHA
ncbi:unnamed protein product [Prorocentrum cordatum]|uniref:Uncharacterized protein n=1 Tax=Prorocentrum cordatum TaxID=2364126 RepID=A0ABN9U062_9DINO|nr:unnamed protein product [Polarella glacialis]